MRTCIGCRKTDAQSQLVRLVRSTNAAGQPAVVVDERRRLPGRGAWLHPAPACLANAVKRKAIGRAFPGTPDAGDVMARLGSAGTEP
ncbi:YlxR family protein [Specibacter cremeus]|uniref:YlxR family protein n=1 Tax=Specibacter cremeus TaxID=1629051 RepID=UPI0023E81922|nr:YlxR family protein [Specibacter cremeus]